MSRPKTNLSESSEKRSKDLGSVAVGVSLRRERVAAVEQAKKHFFNCKESKRRNLLRKKLNLKGS